MQERGCKQERLIGCWKSSPAGSTRALESAITARYMIQDSQQPPNNYDL